MASDLEALYDHFRARGMDEEAAVRQAEQRLVASPEVLQHLIRVHTTGYQRWLSGVAGRLRWGLDLLLFLLGVAPFLAVTALLVAVRAGGSRDDPVLWVLGAVGAAIAGLTLWKAYQLLVRRERSTARLHRGLVPLLFLGAVGPVLGAIASLATLHALAMALTRSRADVLEQLAVAEQVARSGTLLSLGMLLGIGAGLVWFVLANRIARIEQAESAALLAA